MGHWPPYDTDRHGARIFPGNNPPRGQNAEIQRREAQAAIDKRKKRNQPKKKTAKKPQAAPKKKTGNKKTNNKKKPQTSAKATFQGLAGAGVPATGLLVAFRYHLLPTPDLRLVAFLVFACVAAVILIRTLRSRPPELS